MNYVMELGPLADGSWAVFAVDLGVAGDRAISSRMALSQSLARTDLAEALGQQKVTCCPSLASFGRKRGWKSGPVPAEVWCMAATLAASLDVEALDDLVCSPLIDAWLRACVMFLEAEPWQRFDSRVPLLARLEGTQSGSRVLAVTGRAQLPPGLIVLPDRQAFERSHQDGSEDGLDDAVVLTLDGRPGALSTVMARAFGRAFHPTLLCLRKGEPGFLTAAELGLLCTSLGAVASLGTGLDVGVGRMQGLSTSVSALPRWAKAPASGRLAS
jgi:hypothetical protein